MSAIKRQKEQQQNAKRQRRFNRNAGQPTRADWSTVDMAQLHETVVRVTGGGGAIRLGYTADGGAYAIGVYGDGSEPYTEYVRPGEDLDAILADIGAAFIGGDRWEDAQKGAQGAKPSPTAAGQRSAERSTYVDKNASA